jgi:hypothetical protein
MTRDRALELAQAALFESARVNDEIGSHENEMSQAVDVIDGMRREPNFADALLTAWGLAGGECEHGRGLDYCPFESEGVEPQDGECSWNHVRPALRRAQEVA